MASKPSGFVDGGVVLTRWASLLTTDADPEDALDAADPAAPVRDLDLVLREPREGTRGQGDKVGDKGTGGQSDAGTRGQGDSVSLRPGDAVDGSHDLVRLVSSVVTPANVASDDFPRVKIQNCPRVVTFGITGLAMEARKSQGLAFRAVYRTGVRHLCEQLPEIRTLVDQRAHVMTTPLASDTPFDVRDLFRQRKGIGALAEPACDPLVQFRVPPDAWIFGTSWRVETAEALGLRLRDFDIVMAVAGLAFGGRLSGEDVDFALTVLHNFRKHVRRRAKQVGDYVGLLKPGERQRVTWAMVRDEEQEGRA